jgi:hypothetical protein
MATLDITAFAALRFGFRSIIQRCRHHIDDVRSMLRSVLDTIGGLQSATATDLVELGQQAGSSE